MESRCDRRTNCEVSGYMTREQSIAKICEITIVGINNTVYGMSGYGCCDKCNHEDKSCNTTPFYRNCIFCPYV